MRGDEAIPGRNLALGTTLTLLTLVVLVPLSAVVLTLHGLTLERFLAVAASPRTLASYRLTFGASLAGAGIDLFAGTFVAWVLVRYRFPGRRLLDAVVDIPFAIPTAVTGIALATLYGAHGWAGAALAQTGLKIAYTPLGVGLALTFVGFPFVVRTVQPVIAALPKELGEAAISLGADKGTVFRKVTLPLIFPAMLTGFALALARGLGEYGSVIFISGNMPGRTEISPLLIVSHLEAFDYQGAAAIAIVLLLSSFLLLLAINALQRRIALTRVAQ
jgi:sulfate transport system permease protein